MIIQREIFTQIYRTKAAKTKKMNYLSFARTKDNSLPKIDQIISVKGIIFPYLMTLS